MLEVTTKRMFLSEVEKTGKKVAFTKLLLGARLDPFLNTISFYSHGNAMKSIMSLFCHT
jgi:hypothetical protein